MHAFDLQHTLLARHAQHIVLVHFPVALVMVALLFDLLALWRHDRQWATIAYGNLCVAAVAVIPVIITGLLAWHFQLDGAPLRGVLRLHLIAGLTSSCMILLTWWLARRPNRAHLFAEVATVLAVAVTAHLGGIVAGLTV